MRYFLTVDAARSYTVGGHVFEFEPVGLRGGSWLGVLAVDEPAASILASSPPSGVDEIQQDYFDSVKKKHSANTGATPAWPRVSEPPNPALAVAERAGVHIDQIIVDKPVDHNSTANISSVTLLTTKNSPPPEPMLENIQQRRRKAG